MCQIFLVVSNDNGRIVHMAVFIYLFILAYAGFRILQGRDMVMRVAKGFQRLHRAVMLAPGIWMAMFLRLAVKREVHTFALDLISALMIHFSRKIPETSWVCISRYLHELTKKDRSVEV